MTAEHVPQVAALEKVCFSDPWSEKSVASELENPLSCWMVALDGETVAGYVGSQTVMDETDMMNIAVHPDFRRQGVARALILALIGELRKRGSRCVLGFMVNGREHVNAALIAVLLRCGNCHIVLVAQLLYILL